MSTFEVMKTYKSLDGESTVLRLGQGLLHYTIIGHATRPHFDNVIEAFDAEVKAAGHLTFFVDGSRYESYEGAFRAAWIDWFKANKGRVQRVPMLVQSVMVKMGLHVVNVATGNLMEPYTQRAQFDAAIRKVAPQWRPLGVSV